jgi:hypothetical protein
MSVRALIAATAIAGLVAACATVSKVDKVDPGDVVVKDRLVVHVEAPWNKFERGTADSTPVWTVDGFTVDALQFYVGVKDGEPIAPAPANRKNVEPLTFRANMQPDDVVALYQSLFTRDGSSFTLERLEPAEFLGTRGFRFEYLLVRKIDDVHLRGVAWGAVRNGELFVINYWAPRLGFYPRYVARVEALAKSARLRS